MNKPDLAALAAIHDRLLRTMPPGPRHCVLCHGEPAFLGAGTVDGLRIGYWLCPGCYAPGYPERITQKVRGQLLLQRRN